MTTNIIPMTTKNYLVVIIVALVAVWLPHHVSHALIPVISPSFLWNFGVPTAKSSTVGSSTRLYSSPFGSNPKDKPRRQKKNKYKKQEENSKDPLELLLEESEQKLQELNQQKQKQQKKKIPAELEAPRTFVFPDNKDIDPNDPASFGFIEIGTVVGAHGVHGEIKVKSSSGFPERFTQPGIKYFKPHNKRAPRKVVLVKGRGPNKDDEYILQLADTTNRDDAKRLRGGTLFVRKEDRHVLLKNSNNNANTGTNNFNSNNNQTTNTELPQNDTAQQQQQSKANQDETVEEEEFFVSDLVGLEVFLETTTTEETNNNTSENDNQNHEPPQLFVGTVVGVVLAEDMCAIPGLGHDMLEINLPRGKGGTTSLRDELVLIPFVPQIVPRVDNAIFIDPPAGLLDLTYVREEKVRIKGFLPPSE
ncbi:Probable 16S rRNA-processing protein RimM [Seminavis robusta]|uniref:Probable 16S rRNA-processing protein RimM n=1 Tax=Seminavis robusta TaxID=568900 RepID=A0A9N8HT88_9STRA|nr:Probable 16S rRNA-processing protein RimM [Seminavis robusta]|eukprot:Sro1839_g300910.1 Probable 16S rRNA-processing protein RimM (419) ;mRNA; r:12203-13571